MLAWKQSPQARAARFARERLGLHVLPLTIAEFVENFEDETFDVVTFFEVLEHQIGPKEFLSSVKACLKPRGILLAARSIVAPLTESAAT